MAELRRLMISCEHGGNQVPAQYRALFLQQADLLRSHSGYDPGALSLAKVLADGMAAPLKKSETTRLLVDLNRSLESRSLFSPPVQKLNQEEKQQILNEYYLPYRRRVSRKISEFIEHGAQVVHLSVHTFTPNLHGEERHADIGLLYDPARKEEKIFCQSWQSLIEQRFPNLKIRCNYPYRGTADGLVQSLRSILNPMDYLGIELELNQSQLAGGKTFPQTLQQGLLETLQELFLTD